MTKDQILRVLLYIALIQALVATLGSLYFSEIMHLPPCTLCWYQRIAMYPLVVIIAVGIVLKDRNMPLYAIPLSLVGGMIAFYHHLLQLGIVPEAQGLCLLGVSCTDKYFEWLGFITLPLLSFAAFGIITICMVAVFRYNSRT